MDTIVAETGVTLDTRLLRKNIIVLAFEITDNLAEAMNLSAKTLLQCLPRLPCFIIDLISESGCVDNRERNTGSFFIQF
jgi:hypothetical protein